MRLTLAAACAIGVASIVAHAGEARPPLRITTTVAGAPSSPRIGDVLVVEIDVTGDGADAVRIETAPDLGDFEAAGQSEFLTRTDDGGLAHTIVRLPVRAFATGALRAPTVRLVSTRDGATIGLASPQTSISIVPLTAPDAEPAPAKLVLPPTGAAPLVPAVVGGVVVAALGYRAVQRLVGRPAPGEIALLAAAIRTLGGARGAASPDGAQSAEDVRTAAETALAEIASLVAASRSQYDPGELHERLGEAAVAYAEACAGLPARERTTAELLRAIRPRASAAVVDGVARALAACDAVKFAREPASADEFRRVASDLSSLVRASAKAPNDA